MRQIQRRGGTIQFGSTNGVMAPGPKMFGATLRITSVVLLLRRRWFGGRVTGSCRFERLCKCQDKILIGRLRGVLPQPTTKRINLAGSESLLRS